MDKVLDQIGYAMRSTLICLCLIAWMTVGTTGAVVIKSSSGELRDAIEEVFVASPPAPRPESPIVIGIEDDSDSEVLEYPLLL